MLPNNILNEAVFESTLAHIGFSQLQVAPYLCYDEDLYQSHSNVRYRVWYLSMYAKLLHGVHVQDHDDVMCWHKGVARVEF